ncbi:MAG TPA: hypothetical protein VFN18_12095 [Solirubrobacterales bacterium]|nr:hypothetical protein [Solirubrobacterales bacterium]
MALVSLETRTVVGRFESYEVGLAPLPIPIGRAKLFEVAGRPHLLYKEYGKELRGKSEVDRLESLAEDGRKLFKEGASPDETHHIAWPRDFVLRGKTIVEGVVVPRAEERFFLPRQGASLITRSLDHMRAGREVMPARGRLTVMRQLAEAFDFLHQRNLVHGDISHNNILWCPPPRPLALLIDCDGLRDPAQKGGRGTKYWRDPREEAEEIDSPDMYSDWFVLALAIWRKATLHNGAPAREDGAIVLPPEFPLRLGELLRRGLEDDRDVEARPTPDEWAKALAAVGRSRSQCRELDVLAGLKAADSAAPATPRRPASSDSRDAPVRPLPRPPVERAAPQPKAAQPTPKTRRRFRIIRPLSAAAVLALVGLLAVGLLPGTGQPTPEERVERSVQRWARNNLGPGVEAACPSTSTLHAGARYSCKVESHTGAVARVWISIGAERGIRRHMGIQRFRKRSIVNTLRAYYRRRARDGAPGLNAISCPESIPALPGAQMTCRCTFSDGSVEAVKVTLKSHRGRYVWRNHDGTGGRDTILRRHPS